MENGQFSWHILLVSGNHRFKDCPEVTPGPGATHGLIFHKVVYSPLKSILAFTISCSNELINYMVCATVLQSLLTR